MEELDYMSITKMVNLLDDAKKKAIEKLDYNPNFVKQLGRTSQELKYLRKYF